MKTKIGTEVAHVTCDSDTTFKVKRSKVKVTRPLWLVVWQANMDIHGLVTYPYAYMTYIVSPLAGLGGDISWRPPAYSLFAIRVLFCVIRQSTSLWHGVPAAPHSGCAKLLYHPSYGGYSM